MIWFIAIWLPTQMLASEITTYLADAHRAADQLNIYGNTCGVVHSTESAGNFIVAMNDMEAGASRNRVFRVDEQILLIDSNTTQIPLTAAWAWPQWAILSRGSSWPDVDNLGYWNLNWTEPRLPGPGEEHMPIAYDGTEAFTLSKDKDMLIAYTRAKSKAIGGQYRIYSGTEYSFRDHYGIDFIPQEDPRNGR